MLEQGRTVVSPMNSERSFGNLSPIISADRLHLASAMTTVLESSVDNLVTPLTPKNIDRILHLCERNRETTPAQTIRPVEYMST